MQKPCKKKNEASSWRRSVLLEPWLRLLIAYSLLGCGYWGCVRWGEEHAVEFAWLNLWLGIRSVRWTQGSDWRCVGTDMAMVLGGILGVSTGKWDDLNVGVAGHGVLNPLLAWCMLALLMVLDIGDRIRSKFLR